MENQEREIIAGSVDLFLKYGIRSITMDDVARELTISKKTLYKYVSNKADLVDRSVKFAFRGIHQAIDDVRANSTNAIDEIFDIDEAVNETVRQKHPAIEFQLAKYYPKTWKWLESNQHRIVFEHTKENLLKGMEQGLYRADLNAEYIAHVYFGRFMGMRMDNVFPESICENPEFLHQSLIYHVRGIASASGLEYLEEKLQREIETTQTI